MENEIHSSSNHQPKGIYLLSYSCKITIAIEYVIKGGYNNESVHA